MSGQEDGNVIIYGGTGAIGSASARKLAARGLRVHLIARNDRRLNALADQLRKDGLSVETAVVDTLSEDAVNAHARMFRQRYGSACAVLHAVSFPHLQGPELGELALDGFLSPVRDFLGSLFLVAKATTPLIHPSGVFLSFSAPIAAMAVPGHLGFAVTCAGIEAFSRNLATELGPRGVRALCIRPHAIADAIAAGSYTGGVFQPKAEALGLTVREWLEGAAQGTMLGKLPGLDQVAGAVDFAVSSAAGAMTGTVLNLTAGQIVD